VKYQTRKRTESKNTKHCAACAFNQMVFCWELHFNPPSNLSKNPGRNKRLISKQQNQKRHLQKDSLGGFGSFLLEFMVKQKTHGVSFLQNK
jgi:hypothetical protein